MKLSVTSWSFPQLTLAEVAGVARAIGIGAIDLGYFYRSSLDKARLLSEPEAYGQEVRQTLGVNIANLYHLFGSDIAERNLASGGDGAANRADFERALAFCKAAGAPSVFILPGIINPGQGRSEALANTIEALKPLVAAGQAAGIAVCVEPHVHSYLESPALAAALCEGVPGVKLALDYAHFAVAGYRQDEIDALAPHAGHIHLRQARPGALQTKMEEGTLNFPALFATLRDAGYQGYLASEYVNQAYFDTLHDDVLSETIKMRDAFLAWSAK
ncbi:sugar phosphate isomerase/epimerase [Arsenicitalea aurantiaca]|uniref:Sugar phosphate isomerase/epimerase n=1 Tax=Arsenicitalea aurantiaca TaxID=1783274 RepID=A0A433XLB6_9HYPH|nr:sugar phosphate isomerase/epimerase [Arsenicitalea aurantiaca]RUT34876.1 sugar phosphate isomerase/epimerase [Arsenicitalea aurantiaca]